MCVCVCVLYIYILQWGIHTSAGKICESFASFAARFALLKQYTMTFICKKKLTDLIDVSFLGYVLDSFPEKTYLGMRECTISL